MKKTREFVIITGGSKRLGLAMAKKCLQMKFGVIIHYHSSLYNAKSQLRKFTTENLVHYIPYELKENPEILIDKTLELPCKIVGLINNASIFTKGNLLNKEHFLTTIQNNSLSPLLLGYSFAKRIKKGWIVNIIDAHIDKVNLNFQNYRISKKILEEFTRQMAVTFAPHIRVNGIAPGAILPSKDNDNEYFQKLKEIIPLKRTGEISNITDTLDFLIQNSYITGQIIAIDGGWSLVD